MKFLSLFDPLLPNMAALPDSVGLPSGRPVFLPDRVMHPVSGCKPEADIEPMLAMPMFAVKVCRLGKCIDRKFAHRYWESVAPALQFLPLSAIDDIRNGLPVKSMTLCFDASVVTGEYVGKQAASFRFLAGDHHIDASLGQQRADAAINLFSQENTLKTGDVILLPAGQPVSLHTNLIIKAFIGPDLNNTSSTDGLQPDPALLLHCKIKS